MARSTYLEKEVIQEHIDSNGSYNNSISGLTSTSVKGAIDELDNILDTTSVDVQSLKNQLVGGVTYKGGYEVVSNNPSLKATFNSLGGTVTSNVGSNVLTGTGTSFLGLINSGSKVRIGSSIFIIESVESDTEATLTTSDGNFTGESIESVGNTATKAIEAGDMYTVTSDGDFLGEAVTVGDVLIAEIDFPVLVSDWTIIENNIEDAADVAFNNSSTDFTSTNVQTVIEEIGGTISEIDNAIGAITSVQASTVNEETITSNKTLAADDVIYQHIASTTASLEVALPSSPTNGTHFIIKNDDTSTENIDVIGGPVTATLSPGRMYEVIYGATKWMVI